MYLFFFLLMHCQDLDWVGPDMRILFYISDHGVNQEIGYPVKVTPDNQV